MNKDEPSGFLALAQEIMHPSGGKKPPAKEKSASLYFPTVTKLMEMIADDQRHPLFAIEAKLAKATDNQLLRIAEAGGPHESAYEALGLTEGEQKILEQILEAGF